MSDFLGGYHSLISQLLSALCFLNRIASCSLQWPDWSRHRRCGNCCFKEKYSRYIGTEVRARDNMLAAGWGQSLIVNNSAFLLRLNDTDATANMNALLVYVSMHIYICTCVCMQHSSYFIIFTLMLRTLTAESMFNIWSGGKLSQTTNKTV